MLQVKKTVNKYCENSENGHIYEEQSNTSYIFKDKIEYVDF